MSILFEMIFQRGSGIMSNMFDLCKAVAAEGTVLLKNDEDLLPLKKGDVDNVL